MKKILSSVVAAGLIASVAFGEKVKLYTLDFYKNPNYEDTQQCYKFIDVNLLKMLDIIFEGWGKISFIKKEK